MIVWRPVTIPSAMILGLIDILKMAGFDERKTTNRAGFYASIVFKDTSLRMMALIFPVVRRSPAGAMTARFFTSWTATNALTTFATGSSSTGAVQLCLGIKS
jgi:hypothetical protein